MKKLNTLLLSLFANCCIAQQEPIETDRPDQTETVAIVPKKWLQFEAGFNAAQTDGEGNNEFLTPTLLTKYGLSNRMELRLITTLTTRTYKFVPNTKTESGLLPVEAGAKIALWEEKKLRPKTSFIFHVAIPNLASKAYDIRLLAPNFRFTLQNTLSKKFGIGYNLGAEWNGENSKPDYVYTFSPGFTFNDKWYSYIEAFGAVKGDEAPEHNIDGGIAYNITRNCKVDISSGFGITTPAPDWYIALGISARFNTGK